MTNYVIEYKTILRDVINQRPSGTRQRLSETLNKNRSFISQITNPAYSTPIPAKHLDIIFQVCVFSAPEKERFLEYYNKAHPGRTLEMEKEPPIRKLTLNLPQYDDEALNKQVDKMVHQYLEHIVKLIDRTHSNKQDR